MVAASARYVVVDKPAGLLSVPGKGPGKRRCAASIIAGLFPAASGPLVVHRLDMETSGLMVLGLDPEAQRALSAAFEARVVRKAYTALVAGDIAGDSGTISLPIRADIENRPVQIVDPVRGRESVTHWRMLARETDRTRVLFTPVTGRTHQIRVHAASGLGRPIVGDSLYGDGSPAPRLMLHACELGFPDPSTGGLVEFSSPAPF